jgi:hypothetical protein
MSDATSQTIYFFDRHPISYEIILAKLRASRGHLDDLRPEELLAHDQDHYGGVAATDELAHPRLYLNEPSVSSLFVDHLCLKRPPRPKPSGPT